MPRVIRTFSGCAFQQLPNSSAFCYAFLLQPCFAPRTWRRRGFNAKGYSDITTSSKAYISMQLSMDAFLTPMETLNPVDSANRQVFRRPFTYETPFRHKLRRACRDTLPWLIFCLVRRYAKCGNTQLRFFSRLRLLSRSRKSASAVRSGEQCWHRFLLRRSLHSCGSISAQVALSRWWLFLQSIFWLVLASLPLFLVLPFAPSLWRFVLGQLQRRVSFHGRCIPCPGVAFEKVRCPAVAPRLTNR